MLFPHLPLDLASMTVADCCHCMILQNPAKFQPRYTASPGSVSGSILSLRTTRRITLRVGGILLHTTLK